MEGSDKHAPLRPIKVTFNGRELSYASIEEFGVALDWFDREQQFELWRSTQAGPSIAMYRNGENAFLMYLRFNGDSGFVTKGAQEKEGTCTYKHDNGETSELPLSWCIDLEDSYKAIAYFFVNHGACYDFVAWQEA